MKAALFADFIIVVVWLWGSRFAVCLLIIQVTLMGFLNLALQSAHRQLPCDDAILILAQRRIRVQLCVAFVFRHVFSW